MVLSNLLRLKQCRLTKSLHITEFNCTVKPVFKGHLYIREKVSLHHRCPFITGSLTWGRYDTVLRKCPLITGCPLVTVSLEDRFYCISIETFFMRIWPMNTLWVFYCRTMADRHNVAVFIVIQTYLGVFIGRLRWHHSFVEVVPEVIHMETELGGIVFLNVSLPRSLHYWWFPRQRHRWLGVGRVKYITAADERDKVIVFDGGLHEPLILVFITVRRLIRPWSGPRGHMASIRGRLVPTRLIVGVSGILIASVLVGVLDVVGAMFYSRYRWWGGPPMNGGVTRSDTTGRRITTSILRVFPRPSAFTDHRVTPRRRPWPRSVFITVIWPWPCPAGRRGDLVGLGAVFVGHFEHLFLSQRPNQLSLSQLLFIERVFLRLFDRPLLLGILIPPTRALLNLQRALSLSDFLACSLLQGGTPHTRLRQGLLPGGAYHTDLLLLLLVYWFLVDNIRALSTCWLVAAIHVQPGIWAQITLQHYNVM